MAKIFIDIQVNDQGTATLTKLSGALDDVKGKAEAAGGGFGKTAAQMFELGAGSEVARRALDALIEVFKRVTTAAWDMVQKTQEIGLMLYEVGLRTNFTTQQLSALRIPMAYMGKGLDDLTLILRMFSLTALNAAEGSAASATAFRNLGVNVLNTSGQLKPMNELLLEVTRKLADIENPTLRAGLAQQILGRYGTEFLPVLMEMVKEYDHLAQKAKDLGIYWTPEMLGISMEFRRAYKDLGFAIEGVSTAIGQTLMPILTPFLKYLTEIVEKVIKWTVANKEFIAGNFVNFIKDLKQSIEDFMPMLRDFGISLADILKTSYLLSQRGQESSITQMLAAGVETPEHVKARIESLQHQLRAAREEFATPAKTQYLGLYTPERRPSDEAQLANIKDIELKIKANTEALAAYESKMNKVNEVTHDTEKKTGDIVIDWLKANIELRNWMKDFLGIMPNQQLAFVNQIQAVMKFETRQEAVAFMQKAMEAQNKFLEESNKLQDEQAKNDRESLESAKRKSAEILVQNLELAKQFTSLEEIWEVLRNTGLSYEDQIKLIPLVTASIKAQKEYILHAAEATKKEEQAFEGMKNAEEAMVELSKRMVAPYERIVELLGYMGNLMDAFGNKLGGVIGKGLNLFSGFRSFTERMWTIREQGQEGGSLAQFLGLVRPTGGTAPIIGGNAETGYIYGRVPMVSAFAGMSSFMQGLMGGGLGGTVGGGITGLFRNLPTGARVGLGAALGAGSVFGLGALASMAGAEVPTVFGLSALGGPIGLGIGAVIAGLMALFGRRRQPDPRQVAQEQASAFIQMMQGQFYSPASAQLGRLFEHEGALAPLIAGGALGEQRYQAAAGAADALRQTMEQGGFSVSAARTFVAQMHAALNDMRQHEADWGPETQKLADAMVQVTETVSQAIGESQQDLEQAMTNILSLEDQITNEILRINPPTMQAQIQAFSSNMTTLANTFSDPNLTPAQKVQLLQDAFQEVTNTTQSLVTRLQTMAQANQAAARQIEQLNTQLAQLNRDEETRRRALADMTFDVGLGGLPTTEATRLQRAYMGQEAERLRTLLESGNLTGAERVSVAEQAQALAHEIYQSYAMDQTMSLSDIDAVQGQVVDALHFIDKQLGEGYDQQRQDIQNQIDTQQKILDGNREIVMNTFGVQTAAEAIEIVNRQATGYLNTIRDETVKLGRSVATELAPLLDSTSPLYLQMHLAAGKIEVNNTLIHDGMANLKTPMDAIASETPRITEAVKGVPSSIAAILGPILTGMVMGRGQGPTPGGGPIVPVTPQPASIFHAAEAYSMLTAIAAGSTEFTSTDALRILVGSGGSVLQGGGHVRRPGIAWVDEGETVVPKSSGFPSEIRIRQPIQLPIQRFDGGIDTKEFIIETLVSLSQQGRLKAVDGKLLR